MRLVLQAGRVIRSLLSRDARDRRHYENTFANDMLPAKVSKPVLSSARMIVMVLRSRDIAISHVPDLQWQVRLQAALPCASLTTFACGQRAMRRFTRALEPQDDQIRPQQHIHNIKGREVQYARPRQRDSWHSRNHEISCGLQ